MIKLILSALEASPHRNVVKQLAEIVFSCARPVLTIVPGGSRCPVCSARLVVVSRPVTGSSLFEQWKVREPWISYFDGREGEICISCGGSVRGRQLAMALLKWIDDVYGITTGSVVDLTRETKFAKLRIAEINSCGAMHKFLARMNNLSYSEYDPEDGKTRHEDILNLSYSSETFDVVLHSDTLEHIPDVDRALSELRRVLKPGGAMIFSIPVVRDGRKTLIRASLHDGALIQHMQPSYHGGSYQKTQQYLVCSEFGEDIFERVRRSGFHMNILEHPTNPAAFSIIAVKSAD